MSWSNRQRALTALNTFSLCFAAVMFLAAVCLGWWLYNRCDREQAMLSTKTVSQQRTKDRAANVGHASVIKIDLYEQYVDSLRDDMDGAKATISDLDERFKVMESKINQVEAAFLEEKKRANSRYRSIWAEHQNIKKSWECCQ